MATVPAATAAAQNSISKVDCVMPTPWK